MLSNSLPGIISARPSMSRKKTKYAAETLGTVPYIILSLVFLLIIVGLSWCFYRAMTAAAGEAPIQHELDADV